ncbi:MAG: hypothetical protein AAFY74_20560 [Pseudomonadota bacterium]
MKDNKNLIGTDGSDVLYGGMGDDQIAGGNGDDRLFGSDGSDTVKENPVKISCLARQATTP